MARVMTRTITFASRSPSAIRRRLPPAMIASPVVISSASRYLTADFLPSAQRRSLRNLAAGSISPARGFIVSMRRSSKPNRGRPGARKHALVKEKELELVVDVCVEEELPDDPEVLSTAELLRHDVPVAMKAAFGLLGSNYKTRDASINDLKRFKKAEVSVMLCDDNFIQKLNKEWRDEDKATDVLSMSQHIPELVLPILPLGDLVISVETAARQAEERGHTLLDEIRILVVHGLLHLLGFDHEVSDEAEREMEHAEELVLKDLKWRGKGLIKSAHDGPSDEIPKVDTLHDAPVQTAKKEGIQRLSKAKFRYIFCDMDGTLLNSKSQISSSNVEALKEASSRGVNIIIATGKTRPAVINVLKKANLTGKHGISSESTPGVFLQVFISSSYLIFDNGNILYGYNL